VTKSKLETCKWERYGIEWNTYDTECGGTFELFAGDPEENKMKFCPYCGREIKEQSDGE